MTRHQVALNMGCLVFRAASANGKDRDAARDAAAVALARQRFPRLNDELREFVVWALLQAESMYVRVERPALPVGGQMMDDAHVEIAPTGEHYAGDGHNTTDLHGAIAAPATTTDDGGGATVALPTTPALPQSRRRLILARSSPGEYPIYVPGKGFRALGLLTKEDIGLIHSDRHSRADNAAAAEKGWKRIYDFMPKDGVFGDVMADLPARLRGFMASELGIAEWKEAVA